ncbi:RHS repeat protein [Pseudomonas sp. Marseille-Q5299]|uniref:RHS repeat protein n=1 Tax=Pseudomonas sp. Marseille-Q5299 TaxID=2942201 RepID=UPI00255C462C|nr:RHS repeat protein [Pseudomonas sp. Marseille-Q5299]
MTESYPGRSISRSYNINGKLLSENYNGVITSYTYDSEGNLETQTRPGNRQYKFSNYKFGTPQTEVQPEGVSLSRVVDAAGRITAETNGEGHLTRYTYDGMNRITSITAPLGNVKTIAYTSTKKTVTRGSLIETTQYDPFGRVASITLGGITTRYQYDGLDRLTFTSDPGATTGTRYQYDALGRVTRVTNADTSYQAIAYGAGSRTVTDERGKATTETYRGYGNPDQLQLMAITASEPSANVTLTRDTADRIITVKQGAFTRTYGYNANGYLTSVTNPETGKTVYGRDVAGNMTNKQVGASGVTRYTYDGQDRLKSVTYPGITPAVTNTYDKTGKLLASTSTGGNRAMVYDAAGNLIQQSLTLDGKTFTAKYAYNANDQLVSITYPQSGRVVNYTPDVLGRPTTVSGYVNKVTYWPSGMINQITYANGTTTSYTQTSRLWPATFSTAKTGGATYLNSAYTYDGTGNLATIRDSVDSSFNRTLGYDGINRLTSAAGFWGTGAISYDGVGNLLKQTYGTTSLSYTYDAQNRLASVSGQRAGSFTYDLYGNIVSSAGTHYTYDGVPNLVCINCAVAASKVAYQYDAINQRSSVTKAGRKVYEMHDADGKQLIELDGTTLTEYIYLGDKRIADRVSP